MGLLLVLLKNFNSIFPFLSKADILYVLIPLGNRNFFIESFTYSWFQLTYMQITFE